MSEMPYWPANRTAPFPISRCIQLTPRVSDSAQKASAYGHLTLARVSCCFLKSPRAPRSGLSYVLPKATLAFDVRVNWMAAVKLTKDNIEGFAASKEARIVFDEDLPGFGVP